MNLVAPAFYASTWSENIKNKAMKSSNASLKVKRSYAKWSLGEYLQKCEQRCPNEEAVWYHAETTPELPTPTPNHTRTVYCSGDCDATRASTFAYSSLGSSKIYQSPFGTCLNAFSKRSGLFFLPSSISATPVTFRM
jgi:hypothetical protein